MLFQVAPAAWQEPLLISTGKTSVLLALKLAFPDGKGDILRGRWMGEAKHPRQDNAWRCFLREAALGE